MTKHDKYAHVFIELSLKIVDASISYWGLYKELQSCLRKFEHVYPFNRYGKVLFQDHKGVFEMLVAFGDVALKVDIYKVGRDWTVLKRYLDYFQFFSFQNRTLLRNFLEDIKGLNGFMCNEWYRAHMIELAEKNVQRCEDVYFLSTELLMLLGKLTDQDL